MPVASSTDGGRSRSRWARFGEWRRQRPFAGGVLLMIAGLLIAWVPLQFAFELLLVGGSYTYMGLLWAVGVFLTGAFAMYRPGLSTIFGVLGVVISILSLLGALGGFLIGMILGIIGGNLCVAWTPPGDKNDKNESRSERGSDDTTDDRPAVRTDGGRTPEVEPAEESDDDLLGLAAGGVFLNRIRQQARRAAREGTEALRRAESGVDPGRINDAVTSGWTSKRLAMMFALLVVTSGTLTLVSTIPAVAILGDNDQNSYTVDVGEIRLGEGGQICAASGSGDTYYVTITDATLIDATIYQQRGGEAVKTTFPRLEVEDTMVMETSGDNDRLDLLATSLGCTSEDQTSRTVFRNHFQASSLLRGSEGITMMKMDSVDGGIPEPGGFQFVAPQDNDTAADNLTDVGNVTGDVEEVANDADDVLNDSLDERLLNDTGELGDINETVGAVNETVDAVDETVSGVNETVGAVNGTADTVNETVGAVNDTVDRVDRTIENASSGPVDAVNATDNLTNGTGDVVSSVDESVENTTRRTTDSEPPENASDAVDETTDAVDNTTEEVTGTTDDVTDTTDEVAGTEENRTGSEVVDGTTDAVDGTTDTVENTTDGVTDAVDGTTDEVVGSTEETVTSTTETATTTNEETETSTTEETVTSTTDGVTDLVDGTTDEVVGSTEEVVPSSTETTTGTETSTATATTTETSTATATTTDTVTETTETDVPVTETVVPTATPEDTEDLPSWFDQVPDDEEDSVLSTIEETDGGVDDVANVTEDTSHLSEDEIDADENLTQLDNGTVLLLNGTDPLDIDWGSDLPVETGVDSITDSVTGSDSGDDGTATETESESDDTLLRVAG